MKNRKLQVTVIGDSTANEDKYAFAYQAGKYLAEQDIVVISGGRSGVMEAASKGAFEAGGTVVGILPSGELEDANPWCTISIPTGLGHARNAITARSADFIISIGGGAGTLTEIGFGWIFNKPIIAVSKFRGWSAKAAGTRLDDRRFDNVIRVDDLEGLKTAIVKLIKDLT